MTYSLASSINQFHEALLHRESIAFDENGKWHTRHPITVFFRNLFGFEKSDTLDLAKNYARYLDTLSVPSSKTRDGFRGEAISAERMKQITEVIYKRLEPYVKQEEEQQLAKKQAEAQIIGRRIRRAEIALSPEALPSLEHQRWLESQIEEWIKKKEFVPNKKLPEFEKAIVERACRYPEFIEELKRDPNLKQEFLSTILKNTYGSSDAVDIFIQLPKVQRRLAKSFIDMRVRRVGSHLLRFVQQDGKKDAQFLIHGHYVSINDITHNKIESHGDHKSIAELFKMFKQQNVKMPTWEVMKNGLVFTNTPTPHFDPTKDDWYTSMDDYVDYTKEEVKARLEKADYKSKALPHAVLFIKASRTSKKLEPVGNHAWIEVLIPQKDGSFSGKSFGLFASSYPKGDSLSSLLFTFKTHEAIIAAPDANEANYSREHAEIPVIFDSKEQFDFFMNQILRRDLIKAKDGEMIFQGQGSNNCAGWVQSTIDRLYKQFQPNQAAPKLFEVSIEDLDVPVPFQVLTKDPKKNILNFFLNELRIALSFFLGAGELHNRALIGNRFWQNGKQNLPANLFRVQKKVGQIYLNTKKS